MRVQMFWKGVLIGICALSGVAQAAPVTDWTVTVDMPVTYALDISEANKKLQISGNPLPMPMVAVLSPFHIGFGVDVITGEFTHSGAALKLETIFLDVLMDFPLGRWTVILGGGWGTGKFLPSTPKNFYDFADPKTKASDGGAELSPLNLYQGVIRIGRRIGKVFDLHMGYQEFYGQGTIYHKNIPLMTTDPYEIKGTVMTLGFRYDY